MGADPTPVRLLHSKSPPRNGLRKRYFEEQSARTSERMGRRLCCSRNLHSFVGYSPNGVTQRGEFLRVEVALTKRPRVSTIEGQDRSFGS
jgi:hypothetical protein